MHAYFTKDIYIYKMSHFNFYYFYFTPYLIYNHNTASRTEDPVKVFGLQHLYIFRKSDGITNLILFAIYYARFTMHYALCTMHYSLYTMHYALFTMYHALCTMYYALFTMHYALCTIYLYVFIRIYYFIRIHTYLLFHMEIRRNPVILVLTRSSRRVE